MHPRGLSEKWEQHSVSLCTARPLRVFHEVMCGAGVRIIEEADEHKLESLQFQPFILFPYSLNQPADGKDERNKTTKEPRLWLLVVLPETRWQTPNKHKWEIRLADMVTSSSFTGYKCSRNTVCYSNLVNSSLTEENILLLTGTGFVRHKSISALKSYKRI